MEEEGTASTMAQTLSDWASGNLLRNVGRVSPVAVYDPQLSSQNCSSVSLNVWKRPWYIDSLFRTLCLRCSCLDWLLSAPAVQTSCLRS